MAQLERWFDDYNEYHPKMGLKMKSPRQSIYSTPDNSFHRLFELLQAIE